MLSPEYPSSGAVRASSFSLAPSTKSPSLFPGCTDQGGGGRCLLSDAAGGAAPRLLLRAGRPHPAAVWAEPAADGAAAVGAAGGLRGRAGGCGKHCALHLTCAASCCYHPLPLAHSLVGLAAKSCTQSVPEPGEHQGRCFSLRPQIPLGLAADRVGGARLLTGCLFLWSLASLLFGRAPSATHPFAFMMVSVNWRPIGGQGWGK